MTTDNGSIDRRDFIKVAAAGAVAAATAPGTASAQEAGLKGIRVQRSAAEPPEELGFGADRVVKAITDLPQLLKS